MAPKSRPLSPHLQIYKPQLTTMLSILHRFTGVVLSGGLFFLSYFLYAEVARRSDLEDVKVFLTSVWGILFLISILFSFWYHFFNGLRHVLWDMGKGMDIQNVYGTGYFTLFMTDLLTFMCSIFIWGFD